MHESREDILQAVETYYTAKVTTHGATPQGADWNSQESQQQRFHQLARLVEETSVSFSLNDFGCGYGALAEYLKDQGFIVSYRGFDVSPAMIAHAQARYGHLPTCRFTTTRDELTPADYTVASGIFNVKLATPLAEWREYVLTTIDQLAALSTKGFAFNVLTNQADPHRMRPDLYYADPCELFIYCQQRYSRWVALLHDYRLYEFTILVRKEGG